MSIHQTKSDTIWYYKPNKNIPYRIQIVYYENGNIIREITKDDLNQNGDFLDDGNNSEDLTFEYDSAQYVYCNLPALHYPKNSKNNRIRITTNSAIWNHEYLYNSRGLVIWSSDSVSYDYRCN